MSETPNSGGTWHSMMPRSGPALTGIIVIAVVAFVLGGLLFSGGSPPEMEEHDHAAEAGAEPATWTCSMHPQIQLPEAGKCPICFMDLIPLESGGDDELDPSQLRMSETARQLARIETTPARRAFAEREVRMVGKVAYDETSVAYITAWVPGRLDRLYADFTGITVARGDHLVCMYSPDLLAAQEELLQASQAVNTLGRTSSKILKSTAEATLTAVREKLRLYGLKDDQISEIEATGQASDHLTIYAPIGGVVVHKDAQEGMYVETGTRIYTIADLSKLWVMFEAYESDLPWLRYGQQVQFTSPSFPGETFDAVVSFIDPTFDARTRTVSIRAIVDNSDKKLKPDMFVQAVVRSKIDMNGDVIDADLAGKWISPMHPEVVKDGPGACDVCGMPLVPAESLGYASGTTVATDAPLLIPVSAPLITGKRAIVYVELPSDEGPLFEGREVALGPRAGDFYVVRNGIEEGEMVVTNGAFRIDSELQIQARPSMMSPSGGAPAPGHAHGQGGHDVASSEATAGMAGRDRISESRQTLTALNPVYTAYFEVQMALANDDNAAALSATEKATAAVKAVDMSLFGSSGHERWMTLQRELLNATRTITETEGIEQTRAGFRRLSEAVIALHESFGHAGDAPFYLTYCPMAFNNEGAHWLQTENIVWNSFYGAAMLRCGEIRKPLPAISGTAGPGSQTTDDPLTSLYQAYFELGRALTFDDVTAIQSAYREFADRVAEWDEDDGNFAELAPLARAGAEKSQLAAAREAFLPVTRLVLALHEKYGHTENKNYYLIHCPHATDNGGVSWLQDVDTMYNPFLGGVMPECTEKKITLPPGEGKAR